MLNLDITTLRIIATAITFISVLALFSFWRAKALRSGAGYWVLGTFSYGCVYLVTIFIESSLLNDFLTGIFIIGSSLLVLHGTREILKQSTLLYLEIAILVIVLLLTYYFSLRSNSYIDRIPSLSLLVGLVSMLTAGTLVQQRRRDKKSSLLHSGIIFVLYGLYNFLIALYLWFSPSPNFEQMTIYFQLSSLFVLVINWMLVLIAYEILQTESAKNIYDSYQRLKDTESRWLQALDYSNAGAWDLDLRTQEIQFSPQWKRILGYADEEDVDNSRIALDNRIHPEDVKKINAGMGALIRGEIESFKNEHRICRKDGSWIWVLSRGTLIYSDDGQPVRIIGTNTDITEHKNAEAALQMAKEEADLANKAKTTFLSNMSHEIRTPMNAILGFSQLLKEDPDTTEHQQESLGIINNSGEHLLSLINDILDWSRIESGNSRVQLRELAPRELFDEIALTFGSELAKSDVEFSVELSPSLPSVIMSDVMRIRQVCTNLLGNAFKFTHQGKITFKVDVSEINAKGCTLIIQVIDTGVGIAEADADIIFSVFGQTQDGIEESQGSGLGLFISKHMASLLGGDLQFTSQPGAGSCFTFTLPTTIVNPDQMPLLNASTDRVEKLEIPGTRLLIIDDVDSNRQLLKQIFEGLGFVIREAAGAVEGIELLDAFKPDLILMDIRMPGLPGDEAIAQIRRGDSNSNVSIIAVTANALDGEKERLLKIGANDFISKPFAREDVLNKIATLLDIKYIYKTN